MMTEQLPLLSHGLPAIELHARVRIIADGRSGRVAQLWPGRDWYAVFGLPGATWVALPAFRRDELELIDEGEARSNASA